MNASPICAGIVVGQNASTTSVLTAAHCGTTRLDLNKQLFVRASCSPAPIAAVSTLVRHPLFRRGDPDTGYDVAVLIVPRITCALPVRLAPRSVSADPTVLVVIGGTWQELRVSSTTALRLQLARDDGVLCQGSSGMPVFNERAAKLELVGLLSGGRADCRGVLQVGRTDALASSFLSASGAVDAEAMARAQSCAQCMEQQALGTGPCGNAEAQCVRDATCSESLTCLSMCQSDSCQRSCLTAKPVPPPLQSVLRCSCAAGCANACRG